MFDFRYHALSLVAVFVALAIGLLLGVAIGDQELVSSAERKVRDSLRGDVRKAQAQADDYRDQVAERDAELKQRAAFEDAAYAPLVADRLPGRRVLLLALGSLRDATEQDVKRSLRDTGAELTAVAVVREPLDLAELASRAGGTRYTELASDATLLPAFAERIGGQFVTGGGLLRDVRAPLFSAFSGEPFDGAEGVVLVRQPPGKQTKEQQEQTTAFEDALVKGLTGTDTPVVGIERDDTKPSQIPWYRDRGLTSVDDIGDIAGHAALVFSLTGGVEGAFGTKDTADALLPSVGGARR